MTTRRALLATGLAATIVPAPAVRAQAWPTKPIRWIVPFVPGGGTDTVSRLLAEQLGKAVGQQVLVENRGGAGGNIGTTEIARAAPDGHTVGLISVASHAINPVLYKTLPYDPDKDIVAISLVASLANLLTVTPSLPVKTVPELIALLKAAPGKYSFASSGIGTTLHLSGELFKKMAGVDMVHVPYKGAGAAFQDVMSGEVNMIFSNAPSALQHARSGKVRGIAVTSPTRFKAAPEFPTIGETLPGYQATSWYGVGAPAGTPEPVVARIEAALSDALRQPDMQAKWFEMGLDVPPLGREGLGAFVARERALWGPVVRESGARVE
ncbi:MAG: tripartite tricarboxylate transporter substrate binding protein [Rhodospirillales bacterium]|nr:MAG: tripartite tricarboxylate transporter substrate binding protein [Rhodospirillales bacterium]